MIQMRNRPRVEPNVTPVAPDPFGNRISSTPPIVNPAPEEPRFQAPESGQQGRGRWADLPVRTKLLVSFISTGVLVFLLVLLFFPVREWRELKAEREQLVAQGHSLASMLASTIGPAIEFGDTTYTMDAVRKLGVFAGIEHVGVFDADGLVAEFPDDHATSMERGVGGTEPLTWETDSAVHVYVPITLATGTGAVVIEVSQDSLRKRVSQSAIFAVGLSLTFIILGGLLARTLATGIVRPIQAVVDTVGSVTRDGAWNLSVRVPESGRDEPGRMAEWINHFLKDSSDLVASVKHASGQVIVGSDGIKSAIDELLGAAESLSETISVVARNSEAQVEHMHQNQQMVDGANALAASIKENATNAGSLAADVVDSARKGQAEAERAYSQISQISERTAQTRQVMDQLTEHSGRIDKVVDAIHLIAEQTNLLALNAAIEAARAGEHGRGFAVVADEVRKLAEQAARYTTEIGGSITSIRGEVAKAVAAVNEVEAEVEEGVMVIAATAQLLNAVVDEVADDVTTITGLAVRQQSALERVTGSAALLAELGESQAASAVEMAATVDQQMYSTTAVARAADDLHRVVHELQKQMQRIVT
jgi:methyl-accepting chemotaxis protein